jgi:hypothetical protein|tara:strand:+ start:490 stop:804 length:315 start_codon:yes stop_codon:yes gene_type:complete
MSEETQQDHNDGTWSGIKKTIVGTIGTVVAGGGVWLSTLLFGGHSEEPAQAQPAQPSIIINNTQQQQQQAVPGKTVIIKEKSTEPAKPAEQAKPKKEFSDEPKW